MGVRVAGKLPARLDYGVEMAMQRGSLAADSVNAWAGHWQIRESLPGAGAVKLTSEYNFATGDDNPTDGTRQTFDQLYPTGHDKLGLADQVGWTQRAPPARRRSSSRRSRPRRLAELSLVVAGGKDRRASTRRAARCSRASPAAPPTRTSARNWTCRSHAPLTPQIQLAAGYAHMFTGAFLKQATPGASYSAPYVMVTYVFLAER